MKQIKSKYLKKAALSAAVAIAIGSSNSIAHADTYVFSFSGTFTMLTSTGSVVNNTADPYYFDPAWGYGMRSQITGTLTYDDVAKTGTMTIAPFSFQAGTIAGGDPAAATGITIEGIGNGSGGSGNLIMGNMLFNWHGNNGIPVSIVWDASGLLGTLGSLTPGSTIGADTGFPITTSGGAYPASNGMSKGSFAIGTVPMATTTWNTTTVSGTTLGTNPSGQLPLIADSGLVTGYDVDQTTAGYQSCTDQSTSTGNQCALGIGGTPMQAGPFAGFNASFDITKMTLSSKNGITGLPSVTSTLPSNNATGFSISSNITVTFSQNMTASTVATSGAFTVVETATGTPVTGTVTPATGTSAVTFTFDPAVSLNYSTQYTATLATSIQDSAGQNLPAVYTWTFTTQAQPTGTQTCSTPSATVPTGSNFTMLDPSGKPFGGTNDITYSLNFSSLNTSVNGVLGIATNTLASAGPQPFYGSPWTAHHIRLFGPGTYVINTACSTSELENGTCNANSDSTKNLTMVVGTGQIGAHMLFDWNGNPNIDVVNVWSTNAAWNQSPAGTKNDLWTAELWGGPTGFSVDPNTTWAYVSTDNGGDGINGAAMVDGPFKGYSANFNLGATSSCVGSGAVPFTGTISENTKNSGGGCSLNSLSVNSSERADWWLLAGFLTWLGVVRRRFKQHRQA